MGASCNTIYDSGCMFQTKICVVDAYYEPYYVLQVNDTRKTMCYGCTLFSK
jgi:hypothetical protein